MLISFSKKFFKFAPIVTFHTLDMRQLRPGRLSDLPKVTSS